MSDELHLKTTKNSGSVKTSRKFRWSSCFSYVSNKLKRNSKLDMSKSLEDFQPSQVQREQPSTRYSQIKSVEPSPAPDSVSSAQWKQPNSALSPPPRQPRVKRESTPPSIRKDRIPLADPSLTPRVRPRGRQTSLLRLSLDAECCTPEDVSSLSTRSSLSGPHQGSSTKRASDASIPIKWTRSSFESPINDSSISQIGEEEELNDRFLLTLKERRQRKSPLSLSDSLTLTLEEEVLDKSLFFQDRSRQETMRILEGQPTPIAHAKELDRHFSESSLSLQAISESQDTNIPSTHPQFAPSLISVPSSPNSMDSSVLEQEDYINQQHALTVCLASDRL
ncbi:hypothetical protein BY458DRAFT_546340 [Sporodiniella umbellata]|nr:hypothetical protein BY458DRAFT_546340 [Sporodiniella umbellata]